MSSVASLSVKAALARARSPSSLLTVADIAAASLKAQPPYSAAAEAGSIAHAPLTFLHATASPMLLTHIQTG